MEAIESIVKSELEFSSNLPFGVANYSYVQYDFYHLLTSIYFKPHWMQEKDLETPCCGVDPWPSLRPPELQLFLV